MKIIIKQRNKHYTLEVSPFDTIENIKIKLEEKENIPISHQNFIFKDKILNDDKTLSDCNINNKDIIQLVIRIINNKENTDKKIDGKNNNTKEEIISIYNSQLELLPIITVSFDYECKIDEKLFNKLKEELSKIIDKNNFAIIDLQKGSVIKKIVLINDLAKKGIKASKQQKVSNEINDILKKIEKHKFICLGRNCSEYLRYNIPDYSKEENRKKLVTFLKSETIYNEDILGATSTINDKIFDEILETSIKIASNQAIEQEINLKNNVLNNLEEFNKEFESTLQEAKKESIFEFGVSGLSLIDKNKRDYLDNKNNCNNVITKFLFHGTSTDNSSFILARNFRNANIAYFGPGIYMTDMLDYAGFYSFESKKGAKFENHGIIRKINETFNIVAGQIFYDETKLELCYNKTNKPVEQNGIRLVRVNAKGSALSKYEIKEYESKNKFIGNEYIIPKKKQILPLYSITLKRNEYYCLWKDYHFTHQTSFTEHSLHVQNLAKRLLGINIYSVGEYEDALKIIKRKKYNKVILLSNVGPYIDQVKKFINEVRKILKFNVIVLFYTADKAHLNWIKDFENALFTDEEIFFKEYILNYNKEGLDNLKQKIEIEYGQKFNKFQADLSFPLYNEAESNLDYNSINLG